MLKVIRRKRLETKEIEPVEIQVRAKTKKRETEVVVTKKGQTTIPVKLRKKYRIEEGTKLEVADTNEGILFKPKKTIWDMIGAYPDPIAADKIDKLLYKIRHEEEDE